MDLSALIKAVLAPLEAQRMGDQLHDFKPGDKFFGRVLKVQSDGRVLVDLGGTRVLAQIAFDVTPGQALNLQVVENGHILHFRADSPQNAAQMAPIPKAEFLKVLTAGQQSQLVQLAERLVAPDGHLLEESVPAAARNAIAQVLRLFESVPMERSTDQIAEWIKGALEERGALFEKRLADLVLETAAKPIEENRSEERPSRSAVLIARDIKPQLLILKGFLSETGDGRPASLTLNPKELETLRQSTERLLGHVEQQQERAVARWQAGETQQVLVHLLPFQQQQAPVAFKVYYPKKRGQGDSAGRQHNIALLLDMDRLGMVRVDLAMIGDHLRIGFFVTSEEVKNLFQRNVKVVVAAIGPAFEQLQVDIFISREKIARFHEEDVKGAAAGRVDIIA